MRTPLVRRAPRALSVLAAGLMIMTVAACQPQPTPDQDDFYKPPAPLPAGTPGAVLKSRPSVFTTDPFTKSPKSGVSSWQVLYRSQDALGRAVAVSGTVLVPQSTWIGLTPRPIITYAVGTRGLGDTCAPSYSMTQGTDYEGAMISAALDLGFAVVVTDYEGLGTPGPHTYMVGQSQGRAVLDIVRAAQRLPGTGLSTQAPVGIMGYSQGGAGAGWAAQLAPSYAPELQVRGAAMGGVPSDLTRVANFLEGTPYMGFALMASLGLDAAYPDLDLNSYLNARGRDLKNQASSVCLVSVDGFATFLQTAFTRFSDYTTTNPLDAPAWQARLGQQLLGGSAPTVPVYQYHGELDQIIPLDQAETLRNAWCAQGVNLTWKTVPLTEHLTAMVAGYPEALTWMGLTLAGAPSTSTC